MHPLPSGSLTFIDVAGPQWVWGYVVAVFLAIPFVIYYGNLQDRVNKANYVRLADYPIIIILLDQQCIQTSVYNIQDNHASPAEWKLNLTTGDFTMSSRCFCLYLLQLQGKTTRNEFPSCRAVGAGQAGQAGQAMAWPLFDRFLGKNCHNFLVCMRNRFFSINFWLFVSDFTSHLPPNSLYYRYFI